MPIWTNFGSLLQKFHFSIEVVLKKRKGPGASVQVAAFVEFFHSFFLE